MLRHVLCVLALALCCCTSLCVAETGAPAGTVEFPLAIGNDGAEISLTETVSTESCGVQTSPVAEGSRTVTVSITVTLRKKGDPEKTKEIKKKNPTIVKVPLGHIFALDTSLIVECTKQSGADAAITKTNCTAEDSATATGSITYVATAADSTAGGITTTKEHEVKIPVGSGVSIMENVVVKCIPLTVAGLTPTSAGAGPSGEGNEGKLNGKVPEDISTQGQSSIKDDTVKGEADRLASQANDIHQPPGSASHDSIANSGKINGERASEEKDSSVSTEVTPPTSSEAESTETDNSVTVKNADHTAPTATPPAGTTAEGAPKTDAGTPTSAGEGAAANASPALNGIPPSGVKLPDHNTDASSSSTAWVRAPLLLLLVCVAVW
ncbi:hypothetical protein DQ04_10571010 [Trypanosoma grayi]|uniref:hypothetical protein n=1 Tax=Trypanosoma grayi TaxID=71804 RepID=UPI0004F48110|nr:hypothetical protein DQ04_10571010 [Trypanosoma grayi]KEG07203.1 hypothetical protein DQ04_10571010 [Trypanosoma grayi]